MKKITTLFIALCCSIGLYAQDTFSIIAVDPDTGDIGSAGASCVDGAASLGGIIDIITQIIPGRGGVNSQAFVCIPNTNLENAIEQLNNGLSPEEVVDWLINNDGCPSGGAQDRQYGVADFDSEGNPRTSGFTGTDNSDYAGDLQGSTYTIQGNILLNETVLNNMENNFVNTTGTLGDKLMAAMQGANFAGADSRCLDRGTSSTSAYLLVYQSDDEPDDPFIRLNIEEMPFGEEPLDSLQILYDNFLLSLNDRELTDKIRLYPNPASDELIVSHRSVVLHKLTIYDLNGRNIREINTFDIQQIRESVNVSALQNGIYFLEVSDTTGNTATLRFVKQ